MYIWKIKFNIIKLNLLHNIILLVSVLPQRGHFVWMQGTCIGIDKSGILFNKGFCIAIFY